MPAAADVSRAGRSRHAMEQRRIGFARQDPNECRRAKAQRGPATRAFEGQRVERFGPGEDREWAPGVNARASRYDSKPASSSASSVIR